jgi:hypothetical protein
MDEQKLQKIQDYLNRIFKTDNFVTKKRKNIGDSCEIYIGDEFLGLIYEEIEENETAYQFHMTILDEDLSNG